VFQEARELEAVAEAELRCDVLRRPDRALIQQQGVDHRLSPQRELGHRSVHGLHQRRVSHLFILVLRGGGHKYPSAVCSKCHSRLGLAAPAEHAYVANMSPARMIVVAMMLLAACRTDQGADDGSIPHIAQARAICASRLGTPTSTLVTMETKKGALPTLGRTFYTYVFADSGSANACAVDLDAVGTEVDAAKLIIDETAARQSRYASLKPEQYEHVMRLPAEQRVGVAIWIKRPLAAPDFRRERDPFKAKQAFARASTRPLVARLRQQFPQSAPVAIDAAFAVQAQLTPPQILSVARWADVDEVMTSEGAQLLAPAWHGTHRMEKAQLLADGSLGRVGVVEFAVWSGLPVLPPVTVLVNGSSTFPPVVQHVQSVISVLSNTASLVAPGANPRGQVFYAGASSYQGDAFATMTAAVSLLLQQYTDAINISFYVGIPNSSGPLIPTANPEAFGRYLRRAGL